ncbi:MAG: ABC transporter ATP-binding protein, partial [Tissierellia bacterium]|nr:ABC transporter ATP-binding protein [Tissierellia bacterium]
MQQIKRDYKNRELIARFIPYYKNYLKVFFADLFSASMTTVCELALPLILGSLTDLAQANSLNTTIIYKLGILYLVLKIIEIAGRYFMQSLGHIMGAYIERDMRANVFKHLQSMSDSFYSETKIGQLMARITTDLFDITEFSHHCPEEFFIGFVKILISFIVLMMINIPMTITIYILIPIMVLAASKKRRDFRHTRFQERAQIGELNSRIEDTLLGVKVVKSFANEALERKKFAVDNNKFVGIKKQTYFNMAQYNMINQSFSGLMYIVVIIMGGIFVLNKKISAGDLVTFVLYLNTLIVTINRLVEFTDQLEKGITGIERYCEIMDTQTDIYDLEGAVELKDVKGKINFNNVYFQYPDANEDDEWVLSNIDFQINVGDNVAIVGPSGAGKTTLTNLIPRFYDVTRGEILIDDSNIKNYTLESL